MALAQTSRGKPFLSTLARLMSKGTFENGPLWFVQALLILATFYLLWHALAARLQWSASRPFPANSTIALAILLTGAGAFALRLIWPVGTQAIGLQLGYFASYIVLFIAGCAGWPGKVRSTLRWITCDPQASRSLLSLPIRC